MFPLSKVCASIGFQRSLQGLIASARAPSITTLLYNTTLPSNNLLLLSSRQICSHTRSAIRNNTFGISNVLHVLLAGISGNLLNINRSSNDGSRGKASCGPSSRSRMAPRGLGPGRFCSEHYFSQSPRSDPRAYVGTAVCIRGMHMHGSEETSKQ